MKRNGMIRKAANSFVGRVLRRLLGEERGTVMMEYIVVGLLIAAACVVGVAMFGHAITDMFASLAYSMAGDPDKGNNVQDALVNQQIANGQTAAQTHNTAKHRGTPTTGNGQTWTTATATGGAGGGGEG